MKLKTVFFDMNETLLDLDSLRKQFDKHFEDPYAMKYWFTKLLFSSTVMGIMDTYQNFGELADVALENLFYESNKPLSAKTKAELLGEFRKLKAYPDVLPAFQLLKSKGIRVVPVSNSSLQMMEEQLRNAGILNLVDAFYSVDAVSKYKPFSDIYHFASKKEGLHPTEAFLVATHDWDLFGAKKAGLKTGYIKRKEQIYHPLYLQPDYSSSNLLDLIQQILERER